ncbi:MAG: YcgN family cysteine cluster protein [Gammaproteobacteria bacterium]|nr:YcgN family cysteine cluster protein [Gammaproteobacteria bacterium]
MTAIPFWKTTPLAAMSRAQWESLCDGCGRCCLHKLEDIDTGKLFFTSVVCHLFDDQGCRCTHYSERNVLVPDCLVLSPDNLATINFLPNTCAYRLLNEGRDLPDWHPLVSGTTDSVHDAGISVRDKVISETYVHPDDLVNYIELLDASQD